MDKAKLNSIGFFEYDNPFTGKKVYAWGSHTVEAVGTKFHTPILEWDPETKKVWISPIARTKLITTIGGLEKLIDSTNFIMSTES